MAASDDKPAEKLAKLQQRLEALKKARITNFIRKMMNDPEGREFAWWLLKIGHFAENTYRRDERDHAFISGEQNVGLQFLARITEVEPGGFVLMQQEQATEYNARVTEPAKSDPRVSDGSNTDPSAGYYDHPDAAD